MANSAVSNVTYDDYIFCSPDFEIATWKPLLHAVGLALLSVTGTLGNLLVILSIFFYFKSSLDKQPHTIFLGNMAIADFLTSLLYEPFVVASVVKHRWPIGFDGCKVHASVASVFVAVSLFTQAALALCSLCKVCTTAGTFNVYFNRRRVFCGCGAMWLIAAAMEVPKYLDGFVGYDYRASECYILSSTSSYAPFIATSLGVIPALIIAVSYALICVRVRLQDKKFHNPANHPAGDINAQPTASSIHQRKATRKVVKNCFILNLAFYICYYPVGIALLLSKECYDLPYDIYPICSIAFYLGFCINPFLYAWKNPKFVQGAISILRCRVHQHKLNLVGAMPVAKVTKKVITVSERVAPVPRENRVSSAVVERIGEAPCTPTDSRRITGRTTEPASCTSSSSNHIPEYKIDEMNLQRVSFTDE